MLPSDPSYLSVFTFGILREKKDPHSGRAARRNPIMNAIVFLDDQDVGTHPGFFFDTLTENADGERRLLLRIRA